MLNVLRSLLPLFLVSLSCTLFAAPSKEVALDQRDAKALAGLVEDLNRIKTIQGSFVQFAVDQRGVSIQESRGSFKAKRPDMFYWRTDAPLEQEIYSNARFVTVYDPDLEQATIQKNMQQGDHTPAVLFSGDTTRMDALDPVKETGEGGNVSHFIPHPRSQVSFFHKFSISFERTQLPEMRLRDID